MKALFAAIKRSPKLAAVAAAVTGAVLVPAVLMAWGPQRQTFTMEAPADFITFNSVTNNPAIGDERNFVGIREAGSNQLWQDDINVQAGKSYVVRMYIHNNAASNLNLVAHNVTAKFNLPTNTAKDIQVQGFVSASNATPQEVYDHATFHGSENFNLDYQEGTLKFENNHFGAAGTSVPESVFTSAGAKVGYNAMDGNLPGCNEFSGWLSFIVKPQFAASSKFDVKKEVRKSGTKEWKESVAVNPGDSVDYQITYKNTGSSTQKNVLLQDKLPAGLSYLNGTSYLVNSVHTSPFKLVDNITKPVGVNIGDYAAGAGAYVKFSAKVSDKSLICGTKTYVNTIRVTVNENSYKEDTANVTVTKPCAPGEHPVPELPQTGVSTGALVLIGLGVATAGAAYAATSKRVRALFRG